MTTTPTRIPTMKIHPVLTRGNWFNFLIALAIFGVIGYGYTITGLVLLAMETIYGACVLHHQTERYVISVPGLPPLTMGDWIYTNVQYFSVGVAFAVLLKAGVILPGAIGLTILYIWIIIASRKIVNM